MRRNGSYVEFADPRSQFRTERLTKLQDVEKVSKRRVETEETDERSQSTDVSENTRSCVLIIDSLIGNRKKERRLEALKINNHMLAGKE